MPQLAAKYHYHHVSLRRVAAAERWMEHGASKATTCYRRLLRRLFTANRKSWHSATSVISKLAEKLEQAVKHRLERADKLTDNGLRWVSAVSEAAQRIARLALGVSTENLIPRRILMRP